jgi:hypothetical protein
VAGKSSREFEVKFTGDTRNLTKSFGNLQREAGALGKSVQSSSNLMRTALAGVSFVALTRGLQSAVMAASNLSESFAKSNTVFGNNAKQIEAWSRTTAKALGVSQQAALEAAGTYGNLFRAFGINEQESAKMSQALVVLAADLASFNNVPIEDALLALRSGLSGETEPLKRFGIAINDVRLKEQALADGLIETTKGTLPQAIKTQAAYALILKDSALAQGDVARTADGLSNQLKFLQAGLKDAQAGFGELLLPAALSVVSAFNDKLLPALKRVTEAAKLEGAGAGFRSLIGEIAFVISNLTGLAKAIAQVTYALIGLKVAAIALTIAPPIIAAITSALVSMRIAALYGAGAFGVLGVAIRGALASTGIGLLIVGLGLLVGKLIEVKIGAEAAKKEMELFAIAQRRALSGQEARDVARSTGRNTAAVLSLEQQMEALNNEMKDAADSTAKSAKATKDLGDAAKVTQAKIAGFNNELSRNNDILAKAKDAYDSFKSGVSSVITGIIDFGSAATAETGSFLENLVAQADKAQDFGTKVKRLLGMGLSESAIGQVLAAGADAGTKIADEIIAGGATIVDQINTLVSATASVAEELGTSAATQFYQAGITAGQALVDGVRAAIAAAGFSIDAAGNITSPVVEEAVSAVKGTTKAPKKKPSAATGLSASEQRELKRIAERSAKFASARDLARSRGRNPVEVDRRIPRMALGGIVNQPTLALIGEAGPEAVVPLTGRNAGMGNTYNLTINAGMGANGTQIGREIVDAIKKFEKTSGPVFASA